MDLESYRRWYQYSRARDLMLDKTDTADAPWYIIASGDKRRARLNCISHILNLIPYEKIPAPKADLPKRSNKLKYDDHESMRTRRWAPELF
jgi:polyphosphate kinase